MFLLLCVHRSDDDQPRIIADRDDDSYPVSGTKVLHFAFDRTLHRVRFGSSLDPFRSQGVKDAGFVILLERICSSTCFVKKSFDASLDSSCIRASSCSIDSWVLLTFMCLLTYIKYRLVLLNVQSCCMAVAVLFDIRRCPLFRNSWSTIDQPRGLRWSARTARIWPVGRNGGAGKYDDA